MRSRDKNHAEQLGAMLWAARIKCRAAQGARTQATDALPDRIVSEAKKLGFKMRAAKDGKFYL
jgi:hypothetical protein